MRSGVDRLPDGDGVGVQGDRGGAGQGSAVHGGSGGGGDRGQGHHGAAQGGVGAQGRGAADLPEDVGRLCAVDQGHVASGRRDEGGCGLEEEDGVGVALSVQGQGSGDPEGAGGGVVHARGFGGPAEFHRDGGGARPAALSYAVPRSILACDVMLSAACWVPISCPGGKPVTAVPGLSPRSPLMVLGPVLVTVDPPSTAKLAAVPNEL